jgi:hypothetical protein
MIPSFYIVGAPKCGTTSLARWLGEHPRVFMSRVKEPHYFSFDLPEARRCTLREYESLFDAAPPGAVLGEASTHYLRSAVAIPEILSSVPDPRLVFCVRDPIGMALSWHGHLVKVGRESEPDFARAWGLQGERAQGRKIPRQCNDPSSLQYGEVCRVGRQVERLLGRTEPHQRLAVVFDDLIRDPAGEYERVLAFLGLDSDGRTDFRAHNVARETSSVLLNRFFATLRDAKARLGVRRNLGLADAYYRLAGRPPARRAVPPALADELRDYFAPDLALLGGLLGRDLSGWCRASAPGGGPPG